MTIKLLTPRDLTIGGRTVTYPAGALVTLDAATETGLIASKEATATLTGGITYTPPVPSGQPQPLYVIPSDGVVVSDVTGVVATIRPSGQTIGDADRNAIVKAISTVSNLGGGTVKLLPGAYYGVYDVELAAGVSIVCDALPAMNFNQMCADLGLDPLNPFTGGAVFVGTGVEKVFIANTTPLVATGPTYRPEDKAVSGVTLRGLVGSNVDSLVTAGAADHNGLAFSVLEHLYGFKIKGTFINLINPQHINGRNFKAIDCNHVFRVACEHSVCQPGNSHFSDIYNYSWAVPSGTYAGKSTDWAICLEVVDTGRNYGGNLLNYVTLNGRIQCNAFRDTVLNSTRQNCAIRIRGASMSKPVNLARIVGTDIEGKLTYGIDAQYATGLRISTDGWSNYADFYAGIKIRNCLQTIVDSNSFDTTLYIDPYSSVSLSGYVRYFARDNNENLNSQSAKGLYTVFATCTNTAEPPTYTPIKTNGETWLSLGGTISYKFRLSESENVLRSDLVPIAKTITKKSANTTWNRWEACTALLSVASTTQTLPLIDSKCDGVEFTFKAADSNTHTITGQSGQTIDGAATYTLAAGQSVTVVAVGADSKWMVI